MTFLLMKTILVKKTLMKKIKYSKNYYRMRLIFMFDVLIYIAKNVIIFKETNIILSDFN